MDLITDISENEFVAFLQRLGVESYKKSFGWMLNDRDFGETLRWLYINLDHNNALDSREEYRFQEIEKRGQLLSEDALELAVKNILDEFEGIFLPGDHDALEDVKLKITMQKERLNMLNKHEKALDDLLKQTESVNDQLNYELINLNFAIQQSSEDEKSVADECLTLSEDVEKLTESVVEVVYKNLKMYEDGYLDQDTPKKFMAFGPFDSYIQSQALFKSNFNLYTSKKFGQQPKHNITDEDIQFVYNEAKIFEERLSNAICLYVESMAELRGEEAKLSLFLNYTGVPESQLQVLTVEAQSSIEILQQEESILNQRIQSGIKQLVESRTKLTLDTTARAALAVREQMYADISYLMDVTWGLWALDRLLYSALRHELHTLQELLQFASELKLYISDDSQAVKSRIESMDAICAQQELCEAKLNEKDDLLNALYTILGVPPSDGPLPLVKHHAELRNSIVNLKDEIVEGFAKKERALMEFKQSLRPLEEFMWDGSTRQPVCWKNGAAALEHALRQELERVDGRIAQSTGLLASVKTGDKTRKFWQWFLTDPARLRAALASYSS